MALRIKTPVEIPEIEVVGNRVMILQFKPQERTASGLYIPETGKQVPWMGVVVATGPGETAANLARGHRSDPERGQDRRRGDPE